jgi:hypothetical protein
MQEALHILFDYAKFVLMMLPWVFISALLVAGLERIIAHFRGPQEAATAAESTPRGPGTTG